jgi:hypothetical protein
MIQLPLKRCLTATAVAALLCTAFVSVAQWVTPPLLPQLHLVSHPLLKGSKIHLRPAWPIQRELLQAVQRAASPRGGIFLAVSLLNAPSKFSASTWML